MHLYPGGVDGDKREDRNDDKKEDRTKYNTIKYTHDDDDDDVNDNNKYVRGC